MTEGGLFSLRLTGAAGGGCVCCLCGGICFGNVWTVARGEGVGVEGVGGGGLWREGKRAGVGWLGWWAVDSAVCGCWVVLRGEWAGRVKVSR